MNQKKIQESVTQLHVGGGKVACWPSYIHHLTAGLWLSN